MRIGLLQRLGLGILVVAFCAVGLGSVVVLARPNTVLIDDTHDADFLNQFNTLVTELVNEGYTVDSARNTGWDLSGYGYLMIYLARYAAYTAAERNDIEQFLLNGGRLILVGDHYGYTNNENLNTLATGLGLGIQFNNNDIYDPVHNDQSTEYWPIISNFATHPLTQGLTQIAVYAAASLNVTGSAIPLATGSADSYVTPTLPAAESWEDGQTSPSDRPSGSPQTRSIVSGAPIVVAYQEYGSNGGDVAAIGDSNILRDDGSIGIDHYDNLQFFLNLFTVTTEYCAASLAELEVAPNPFRPNDHNADTGTWDEGVYFSLLTCEAATIDIYTLTGELVQTLELGAGQASATWDARNHDGQKVASGIYFYVVRTESHAQRTGKVVVIR